ncbi:hypothetical protein TRIP_B200398 [uncultured Desulfatiglans sp.]|uniref:Uncharacterized protein n=1 Tax=Uncultured Desulfatiglans sp. TaxID=1748965 RepID=A0A653A2T3_UNCDX|nr:hypothetical protein TRIP_B200398 [uncultured Desulfatiglans sp.]
MPVLSLDASENKKMVIGNGKLQCASASIHNAALPFEELPIEGNLSETLFSVKKGRQRTDISSNKQVSTRKGSFRPISASICRFACAWRPPGRLRTHDFLDIDQTGIRRGGGTKHAQRVKKPGTAVNRWDWVPAGCEETGSRLAGVGLSTRRV